MDELDLIVSSVTASASARLNDSIDVSWTVTNQSDGFVSVNYWYDSIYISDNQVLDGNDTFVTDIWAGENTSLGAFSSYTFNKNIYLPNTAIGDRYLLFITDVYNYQSETDETNNVFAQAITLTAPDVDLVVSNITAPTSANLGEQISVSWTVENQGTDSALADWSDAFYLSADEFLDENDIYITEAWVGDNTPLEAGSSYITNLNLTVPSNFSAGSNYILVVTDFYNQQSETEENNVFAQAITIPGVDLVVSNITAPISANLGEQISVSWTVENQGTGSALADWYDAFYFSEDEFLDENDIYITEAWIGELTPLEAGSGYITTWDLTVPSNFAIGSGYILIITDFYNEQSETDEANVFAQAITINTPEINLVVTDIVAPSSATNGQYISISWTVQNQGITATNSTWYDRIFYSTDDVFGNSDDVYLTQVYTPYYANLPLDANGTYTLTTNVTPFVKG